MPRRRTRWDIAPPIPPEVAAHLPRAHPLLLQLLFNRHVTTADEAGVLLYPDAAQSHDPFLLPDMSAAVERIARAIESDERIAVYGDFDVDGVTSTALLVTALSKTGASVIPYIPHRLTEGYGLSSAALSSLRDQGVSLVITVDCGVGAVREITHAREIGMDVVVTDHHTVPDDLPSFPAPLVNPRRADSTYPFPHLAGVGVAYKLVQALGTALGKREMARDSACLDLVAAGTVADIVPLLGENRYYVKRGLEVLNQTPRLGLRELAMKAGLQVGKLDAESLGFGIGPRLNAAGRLEHAMTAYRLLVASSSEEARALVEELDALNSDRQQRTKSAVAAAKADLAGLPSTTTVIMSSSGDYPPGIIGLIAGRLADEYQRPAVVVALGHENSVGSVRSPGGFNVVEALRRCEDLLVRFGGHPQAAGFMAPTPKLIALHRRLEEIASTELGKTGPETVLRVDAELPLSTLSWSVFQLITQLAPFGAANPYPLFMTRGARVVDSRIVGSDHLKLRLSHHGADFPAIGFRMGDRQREAVDRIDVVYTLQPDDWNGPQALQLHIKDLRPSVKSENLV